MKPSVPLIAPLLRSNTQGLLLAELLLDPTTARTLADLVRAVGTSKPTVHREIDRLVDSGFLLDRRSGRNRYVQANPDHPLYAPVRQIVEYAYGPVAVMPGLIATIPGVESAYVYGSWAARLNGVAGPDPADLDVLLVGRPDRATMYDVANSATTALRREVNLRSVTSEAWKRSDDPFLESIRSRPLVRIALNDKEAS